MCCRIHINKTIKTHTKNSQIKERTKRKNRAPPDIISCVCVCVFFYQNQVCLHGYSQIESCGGGLPTSCTFRVHVQSSVHFVALCQRKETLFVAKFSKERKSERDTGEEGEGDRTFIERGEKDIKQNKV